MIVKSIAFTNDYVFSVATDFTYHFSKKDSNSLGMLYLFGIILSFLLGNLMC